MTPLPSFLWGFGGSLAVEIVSLYEAFSSGPTAIPPRYKSFWFWVCRLLVAFVGGGLAVAHGIQGNPLLAANVGAATPLIIHSLSRGVRVPTQMTRSE